MTAAPARSPGGALLGLIALAIVVESIASARIGYPSFDFRHAMLVLLTGWVVGGVGLMAWARVPVSRIGPLLVLTAAAWYLSGFRWVAWDPAASAAEAVSLLYAAVAGHAILTFPTGRTSGARVAVAVVAVYVASLLPVPRSDLLTAALLVAGLAVVVVGSRAGRAERRPAVLVGLVFAIALGGHSLLPTLVGLAGRLDSRPVLQAALALVALGLAAALLRYGARSTRVADLVVELGWGARSGLVAELGDLLGDPTLELGFWLDSVGGFVDARGRPVAEPEPGSGRAVTRIDRGGGPLAILVHAATTRVDPEARAAVTAAATLSVANARLQVAARDQVRDVQASRRRLLVAADEERGELEHRLREGLDPRLAELAAALAQAPLRDDSAAGRAREQLRDVRQELGELAQGIHPLVADGRGLSGAIADLAARAPMPVQVDIQTGGTSSRATRSAILFVASEALANVAKHAQPTQVHVSVRDTGRDLVVEVTDDGRGGADPGRGTGLRGLRDRVEALGGSLSIDSRAGAGTRLVAVLPREEGSA